MKEVTNGHGATCGSGFLDSRMRDYITRKFAHIGPINDSAMEHIMETFVNIIKVSWRACCVFESFESSPSTLA